MFNLSVKNVNKHTLSYFFSILRMAMALIIAYLTRSFPSWIKATWFLCSLSLHQFKYFRKPEARCSLSNFLARLLKHPTTADISLTREGKKVPSHTACGVYYNLIRSNEDRKRFKSSTIPHKSQVEEVD